MNPVLQFALVGLGGAFGAMGRYGVSILAARQFGVGFPWGTLSVNILGSFLMGLLMALLAARAGLGEGPRLLLATGVLGGFTTFSAFSLEAVALFEREAHSAAALYVGASVVLAIAGLMLGLFLGRQLG